MKRLNLLSFFPLLFIKIVFDETSNYQIIMYFSTFQSSGLIVDLRFRICLLGSLPSISLLLEWVR